MGGCSFGAGGKSVSYLAESSDHATMTRPGTQKAREEWTDSSPVLVQAWEKNRSRMAACWFDAVAGESRCILPEKKRMRETRDQHRGGWWTRIFLAVCVLAMSAADARRGMGQVVATLRTSDTVLSVEAGRESPSLVVLGAVHGAAWRNRGSDTLPDHVEVRERAVPIVWELERTASRADARHIAFVYRGTARARTETHGALRLRLTWEWRLRAGFGPIEHAIRIENLGGEEIWLPLQDSLRFAWLTDANAPLEQIFVEKGAGTPSPVGVHQESVPSAYAWEGRSGPYASSGEGEPREIIPWFLVQRSDGDHEGWYVGVEFSGRVWLTLQRDADALRGVVGLNPCPGPFRTRLAAGGSFATPVIFLGASRGGADAAGNVLRPWVRQVLGNPAAWKNPNYPLLVNNSWGSGLEINEALTRRMIGDSADLGFEMVHVDAGWFRGVGDWYPDEAKFPHGLATLAGEAHARGLKFGLWAAWTQAGLDVQQGALNARDPATRDWLVADVAKDWKPEGFKGRNIDLGVPAAQAWAQREVARIVTEYQLDMLEHDGYLVAQNCDRADHPHAPPREKLQCPAEAQSEDGANATDVSYRAARAYYEIQSRLRKMHPALLLEICNDGGRMVDFGSAAHGDYFSITDTFEPLSNRRAFFDASHVLPPAMLEAYVEKWDAPRMENFRYQLRSGMMGWLTVMMDTTAWSAEQRRTVKDEFLTYKKMLRPLIRDAELFHISERPDGVHWDGIEYFDPRSGRGVVYAFHGTSPDEPVHVFKVAGLSANEKYKIRFQDGTSPGATIAGQELLDRGLEVHLEIPNSSELVFIEAVRKK
jgi:hypothetical protein